MYVGLKEGKDVVACVIEAGISRCWVLVKMALKTERPTRPPTLRTPITSPVTMEMRGLGVLSWAVAVRALREILRGSSC